MSLLIHAGACCTVSCPISTAPVPGRAAPAPLPPVHHVHRQSRRLPLRHDRVPEVWRALVTERCQSLRLRGTILLAPEGINLFSSPARARPPTRSSPICARMRCSPRKFADLQFKESLSDSQPFRRMLVRLKREIITMKKPVIQPELGRAPSVDARTLKAWLNQGHDDESRPVVILDTRNAFEVDVGTFDQALDYRIDKFSEFPAVIDANRADFEGKTVVSFCTDGIRCEKAAIHMKNIGIDHVYQLEGGILKYFEEVGGAHYHGDCFVFDYRTALNPRLEPTADVICFACRAVVSAEDQQSPHYVPSRSCPACAPAQPGRGAVKSAGPLGGLNPGPPLIHRLAATPGPRLKSRYRAAPSPHPTRVTGCGAYRGDVDGRARCPVPRRRSSVSDSVWPS
ncbi:MAG: sulfurtransferase [Burkholderia sp.]